MSQQEFSYFHPEEETVYEPREVNRDLRELREEQEETVYYVTPEQSMLRGEKLIPMHRTKPHANWVAAAVFLLMMLIGGLIWGIQVRASHLDGYGPRPPIPGEFHNKWDHEHPHPWENNPAQPLDGKDGV